MSHRTSPNLPQSLSNCRTSVCFCSCNKRLAWTSSSAFPDGLAPEETSVFASHAEACSTSNSVFSASECLHLQASRPQMKRWIDSFGEVYSKAVIAATLVILLVLPMLGVPMLGSPTQSGAFYRAMGFLTAASPCALVLVPLAYVSAIGAVTSR